MTPQDQTGRGRGGDMAARQREGWGWWIIQEWRGRSKIQTGSILHVQGKTALQEIKQINGSRWLTDINVCDCLCCFYIKLWCIRRLQIPVGAIHLSLCVHAVQQGSIHVWLLMHPLLGSCLVKWWKCMAIFIALDPSKSWLVGHIHHTVKAANWLLPRWPCVH